MRAHTHVRARARMYSCGRECVYVYMYMYTCICVCLCVFTYMRALGAVAVQWAVQSRPGGGADQHAHFGELALEGSAVCEGRFAAGGQLCVSASVRVCIDICIYMPAYINVCICVGLGGEPYCGGAPSAQL